MLFTMIRRYGPERSVADVVASCWPPNCSFITGVLPVPVGIRRTKYLEYLQDVFAPHLVILPSVSAGCLYGKPLNLLRALLVNLFTVFVCVPSQLVLLDGDLLHSPEIDSASAIVDSVELVGADDDIPDLVECASAIVDSAELVDADDDVPDLEEFHCRACWSNHAYHELADTEDDVPEPYL